MTKFLAQNRPFFAQNRYFACNLLSFILIFTLFHVAGNCKMFVASAQSLCLCAKTLCFTLLRDIVCLVRNAAKTMWEIVKNSAASNLNYMARNLNLVARSFYEMPCSFLGTKYSVCVELNLYVFIALVFGKQKVPQMFCGTLLYILPFRFQNKRLSFLRLPSLLLRRGLAFRGGSPCLFRSASE